MEQCERCITSQYWVQITAPADTTPRTIYVYVGGYEAVGQLTASLSDGSAANFVAPLSYTTSTTTENLVKITYSAGSANQKLTITYLKTGNVGSVTNGSVNLIAAWF